MIGKVITGKSFGGCIRYLMNRQEATVLKAEGVRMENARAATDDFNLQRKMNPGLGKAVGHIVLSWSKEDSSKLTPEIMIRRAGEYLEKMGIRDTQCLLVQHTDKQHPHLHIVYNRVDNEGKTISDRFQKQRNVRVCKAMTLQHGYHLGKGKQQVNRQRLTGANRLRYVLYDAIGEAARTSQGWRQLESELAGQGIGLHYKYRKGTNEVQGISFSKDGMTFKGSAIDRAFSYSKLDKVLEQNQRQEYRLQTQRPYLSMDSRPREFVAEHRQEHAHPGHLSTESMLNILLTPTYQLDTSSPFEEELRRRKKKKRKYKGVQR